MGKKTEDKQEEKVYEIEDLWKMKFRDSEGTITMVRRAFKPRGKLEFYQPLEFTDETV